MERKCQFYWTAVQNIFNWKQSLCTMKGFLEKYTNITERYVCIHLQKPAIDKCKHDYVGVLRRIGAVFTFVAKIRIYKIRYRTIQGVGLSWFIVLSYYFSPFSEIF